MKYFKIFVTVIKILVLFAFIALSISLLVACGSTPVKPDTIIKYELIKPSPYLLEPCSITEPPNKKDYMSATPGDKEKYLSKLSLDLYRDINLCNNHWNILKKWYADQENVYNNK